MRNRLGESDILAALWQLILPLLEPRSVARFLNRCVVDAPCDRDEDDDLNLDMQIEHAFSESFVEELLDDWDGFDRTKRYVGVERQVREFFATLPRWATPRLAEIDGDVPTSATVALLGQALGLDETEVRILDYLDRRELSEPLRTLLRASHHTRHEGGHVAPRVNVARLAAMLGLPKDVVRIALDKRAPLRAFGLVDRARRDLSDLEDFLSPSDLLGEVMLTEPRDADALLALLIEPAPAGAWRLEAFPHLADESERLRAILREAVSSAAIGVNALFHGSPGTGKTELARSLSDACGLRAYQVRSADDDGDGLRREGRLSAYLLAQRLLAKRRDALLIFDEIEDVFFTGGDLLALLGGHHGPGRQKGWMNRILEENPVPAIWITNDTDGMDQAFLRRFVAATNLMSGIDAAALRRFDFKLHFRALTPGQRQTLFAREALGDGKTPVPPELACHLAGLQGLTPGDFANVCRQRSLLAAILNVSQKSGQTGILAGAGNGMSSRFRPEGFQDDQVIADRATKIANMLSSGFALRGAW